MKKTLLSVVLFYSCIAIYAYDFEAGGIFYNVVSDKSKTCEVTFRDTLYEFYHGDVVIPEQVTYNNTAYKVIGIGDLAFRESYRKLHSVEIPNTIEYIGRLAFSHCFTIKKIVIPQSVRSIHESAFNATEKLHNIIVDVNNEHYADIDGVLFTKDKTLLVSIPYKKKNIYIPEKTRKISRDAYDDLHIGRHNVTIESSTLISVEDSFREGWEHKDCIITVPAELKNTYMQSKAWGCFKIK